MDKEQESIQTELENDAYNEPQENPRAKKATKIVSIIISVLLYAVIIVLILNFCGADHKELDSLYITNNLRDVYENSTDLRTHVAGTEMSENGAIYAFSFVYNEQNSYMQLTVRYNVRHLNEVVQAINENATELDIEYTLDDIGVYYEISDSNGKIYEPTVLDTTNWRSYVYFKLELTNVDFTADSLSVNMMLKNVEQVEIDGKTTLIFKNGSSTSAGSTLTFHEKDDTYIPYKLSRKEKKELE